MLVVNVWHAKAVTVSVLLPAIVYPRLGEKQHEPVKCCVRRNIWLDRLLSKSKGTIQCRCQTRSNYSKVSVSPSRCALWRRL
jgi:hypothetical protein